MSWKDRLRPAVYQSPSGERVAFQYVNVASRIPKRTAPFEFPNVDGAYVQDNGFGSKRYPLLCFFWGDDHDLEATQFENALLERGRGVLEHPLYGPKNVVPFGDIGRRDDLVTAGNQTIFEVTFWESLAFLYPFNQLDANATLEAIIDGILNDQAPGQFDGAVDVKSKIAQQNLAASTAQILNGFDAALGNVARGASNTNALFTQAFDAVNLSLDVLVGDPLLLGQQMANLITLPARATAGVIDRLVDYSEFAVAIFNSSLAQPSDAIGAALPRRGVKISNDFHVSDLSAASAVTGSILSVQENQFRTRPETISAAESVVELFDAWVAWRDPQYAALGQTDPGTSYQGVQQAVALVTGLLVEVSFTLTPERRITLDRKRCLIDVCGELFQTVSDERLDQLINNNALTGDEILELPTGRELVYYP